MLQMNNLLTIYKACGVFRGGALQLAGGCGWRELGGESLAQMPVCRRASCSKVPLFPVAAGTAFTQASPSEHRDLSACRRGLHGASSLGLAGQAAAGASHGFIWSNNSRQSPTDACSWLTARGLATQQAPTPATPGASPSEEEEPRPRPPLPLHDAYYEGPLSKTHKLLKVSYHCPCPLRFLRPGHPTSSFSPRPPSRLCPPPLHAYQQFSICTSRISSFPPPLPSLSSSIIRSSIHLGSVTAQGAS